MAYIQLLTYTQEEREKRQQLRDSLICSFCNGKKEIGISLCSACYEIEWEKARIAPYGKSN